MRSAVLAGMLVAATVHAEHTWERVTKSSTTSDGTAIYIDTATRDVLVEGGKPMRTAWFKGIRTKKKKRRDAWIHLLAFDCGGRLIATIQYVEYDARGDVAHVEETPKGRIAAGLVMVAPDTVGEAMLDRVCGDWPPKSE